MDRLLTGLIDHMSGFVTESRIELFKSVLDNRTRYVTVLLEDIYQSQNASAVLRTCDCVGIQDLHIVEESNEYELNPDVTLGSNQWLTVHHYQGEQLSERGGRYERPDPEGGAGIIEAVNILKKRGYRIVATTPNSEGVTPEQFDLQKGKVALLFGTELSGLTERAMNLADEFIRIPMVGFTESYNISVSAALILYTLRKRLEQTSIDWRIREEEQAYILLDWLRGSIKLGEQIEKKFLKEQKSTFY